MICNDQTKYMYLHELFPSLPAPALFKNTNVEEVLNRRKQQRDQAREDAQKKKEQDKVQREKDKLAKQERKDKEKKRTQKGERKRQRENKEQESFCGLYNTKVIYLQEKNTMRPQQTVSQLTMYASISCFGSNIAY